MSDEGRKYCPVTVGYISVEDSGKKIIINTAKKTAVVGV